MGSLVAVGLWSAGLWNGIHHGDWKKGARQICVAGLVDVVASPKGKNVFFAVTGGLIAAGFRGDDWKPVAAGVGMEAFLASVCPSCVKDELCLLDVALQGGGWRLTLVGIGFFAKIALAQIADCVWDKASRLIEQLPSREEENQPA